MQASLSSVVPSPRIAPVPPRRVGLFVRFVRWFARRRFGRVPGAVNAYAHSRPLLAAVGGFELAADRARAVPPRLKALSELKVAALVGCPFCLDLGSSLARGKGVGERQVIGLAQYRLDDAFSSTERLALDLAVAMTETPVRVPDPLVAALRAELGDEGVVELSGAIAWENFRARMNHALGLQSEGFSEGAVCAVAEPGRVAPR